MLCPPPRPLQGPVPSPGRPLGAPCWKAGTGKRATEALADIEAALAGLDPANLRPSLSGGTVGISLFFAYRSLAMGETEEGPLPPARHRPDQFCIRTGAPP